MIDRIKRNEERLDNTLKCIHDLEEAFQKLQDNQKEMKLLNKYYGSKEWFQDKENYEQGKIQKIKAGVLSEDTVWNMNEEYRELMSELIHFANKIIQIDK